MASQDSNKAVAEKRGKAAIDITLRNTLRYTISAKEYESLHRYIISRSKILKKNAPTIPQVEKLVERSGRDDFNAAAIRDSLRLFIATAAGLKVWAAISERILKKDATPPRGAKTTLWSSPNFRLSLSLSSILLFHRLLFRFFTRLRAHLLAPDARPFRQRNPRTSRTLTSSLAPAIGASLAGFMLGVYPSDQFRVTVAIYALSRAAEFAYNLAEDEGWIWSKFDRPWWWGSWMLMPLASGQLLHAFVFDRDCFPKAYGDFILKNSPQYIQTRPADYPPQLPWPGTFDIVDNLAETARLNYPPFISPILFPNKPTLPPTLSKISPITSTAHPILTHLTCATLHPHDPSCLRTYLTYWLQAFPQVSRFFLIIYGAFSIFKYKSFYKNPVSSTSRLIKSVLRTSTFITGAIGTSWGAICFFQHFLSRSQLPTQRFFFGGFIGGLWALLERESGRGSFLYSARASMDSLWKVGVKRGWWKGVRNGDVWLFVVSLMVINGVFTRDRNALRGGAATVAVKYLRGMDEMKEVAETSEGKGKNKET